MKIALVPPVLLVMLPLANGIPKIGRTKMLDQVKVFGTLLLLLAVMLTLMVLVVIVTGPIELPTGTVFTLWTARFVSPKVRVTTGVAPVSKMKPDGAFNTISPVPIWPGPVSVNTGPVRLVQLPPAVSAEMALPPEAGVIVTPPEAAIAADCASRLSVPASRKRRSEFFSNLEFILFLL
jgi:hypothetical protein